MGFAAEHTRKKEDNTVAVLSFSHRYKSLKTHYVVKKSICATTVMILLLVVCYLQLHASGEVVKEKNKPHHLLEVSLLQPT